MGEVPPLPAYEVLPFAPGEGPFRVKGIAYRGHCEYVERFLAGGLGAQQAAIVDERLRGFLGQTFLASSWYDVYPLVAAGSACARVAGRTLPDFLRARARFQAEQDLQGVYRAALTVASPALLAEKLPPMFQRYFDFGHAVVHEIAPNAREAHVEGVPATLAPWLGPILQTFSLTALEYNGTRRAVAKLLPFRATGTAHGLEIGVMRLAMSWP